MQFSSFRFSVSSIREAVASAGEGARTCPVPVIEDSLITRGLFYRNRTGNRLYLFHWPHCPSYLLILKESDSIPEPCIGILSCLSKPDRDIICITDIKNPLDRSLDRLLTSIYADCRQYFAGRAE